MKEVFLMNIEIGTENSVSTVVDETNIASSAKSGALPVFATPCMVALMEQAAAELVQRSLADGSTTVGIQMNVSHLAATAVGATVTATAKVTAVDGRKIDFEVTAFDNAGMIGKGEHTRFVVYTEKFMAKAEERKNIVAK